MACLVFDKLVIHQHQCLCGHGALHAQRAAVGGRRRIKELHARHQQLPLHIDVNTAPPVLAAFGFDGGPFVALACIQQIRPDARLEARTTRCQVEPSAGGEDAVTHHLGLHPLHVHAPEKMICRVQMRTGFMAAGLLPVGRRHQHQFVQRFQAAAIGNELPREPVEQFWMRGPSTGDAEVARCGEQARAEMMLPHTVHHHPPGQRMRRRGDPLCQGASPQ